MAVQRRNFDFASQGRLAETYRHFAVQIVFFACENLVRAYVHDHIKIARWTAVHPRFTFSGQTDAISLIYAGWNCDRECFLLLQPSGAATGCTGILHNFATALAFRTCLLDGKKTLRHADLALAVTRRTGNRLAAGLGTTTLASVALLQRGDANAGLGTSRGLFQRNFQVVTQVGSAIDIGARATTAENVAENIAKCIGETANPGGTGIHAGMRLYPSVPVLVVSGPFAGVAKNFVSFLGFLERFFRLRIIRIAIRVIFHRQLAIRFLDIFF